MAATRLPIYQVDAFADAVFTGNPAAVCPLDRWLPDDLMQAIAAENNLAETAFFVPAGEGWHLRWFTPAIEVELCGHATLASGFIISTILEPGRATCAFTTQTAGPLTVTRASDRYELALPRRDPPPAPRADGLADALGIAPLAVHAGWGNWMAVLEDEEAVRGLQPNLAALARLDPGCAIVTAPGRAVDFVSRYFAPAAGIPEDPVTGSAHCMLAPYWAGRLGRTRLKARQVSPRGGNLDCRVEADRVVLGGRAVLYLEGSIYV
jgi:PhzF family phenazine biosynthesis protein